MALQDWESVSTGTRLAEGTVIVIGAGASKHLGLPLADELLPRMFAYANGKAWEWWGGREARKNLYDLLRAISPSFSPYKSQSPGLEYFLSQMDVYQHFLARGVMGKDDELVQINKKRLVQILADYLWSRMVKGLLRLKRSSYLAFVSSLSPKDTVLSLNWDLAIEWAFSLCGREKDWSYIVERSKVPILKLHGSISWRHDPEGFKPAHPEAFSEIGSDVRYSNDSVHPGHSEEGSLSGILDEIPALIPPSYFKAMESETLRRTWKDAYDRLLSCTRIIIVGSSLREDDRHLYSLFSLAFWNWKNAISSAPKADLIVDPNKRIAEKFKQNIFPKCEVLVKKFEDVNWRSLLSPKHGRTMSE